MVKDLVKGLETLYHVILINNVFTSMPLFMDLFGKGIYAMSVICSNQIGLSKTVTNIKELAKTPQKTPVQ